MCNKASMAQAHRLRLRSPRLSARERPADHTAGAGTALVGQPDAPSFVVVKLAAHCVRAHAPLSCKRGVSMRSSCRHSACGLVPRARRAQCLRQAGAMEDASCAVETRVLPATRTPR